MRPTPITLAAILALSATATIALAGNNNFKFNQSGRSGNQHSQNGGGNGGGNGSQGTRSQFSRSTTKKLQGMTFSGNNQSSSGQTFQKFSGTSKKFKNKPIDPGIGNGQHGHGHHDDHHGEHHGDHHGDHHHHGQHHKQHHQSWPWPWVISQPFAYPTHAYPSYPIRVARPVVVNRFVPVGPQLVAGIDLQLVDLRLMDNGDANRNLGPRFRVVVGNRGTRAAGNFQVLAVAAKNEQTSPDSPSAMVEVPGIASGQIAKVDIRLPIEAMTVTDGQPFKFLAVVVDVSKLIDETVEEDNAVLMERDKVLSIQAN